MGGDSVKMRSISYTIARLNRKRVRQIENDRVGNNENNMFGDDDMK